VLRSAELRLPTRFPSQADDTPAAVRLLVARAGGVMVPDRAAVVVCLGTRSWRLVRLADLGTVLAATM
jgi:hypothetical protein